MGRAPAGGAVEEVACRCHRHPCVQGERAFAFGVQVSECTHRARHD